MSSSTFQVLGERVRPGGSEASDDEKLQRFSLAKKELGDVYYKLGSLIRSVLDMRDGADEADREKFLSSEIQKIMEYHLTIGSIELILRRDKMKVVFFGSTSNGKSTVANAMIFKELLPSGIGTTTCCFLQVEGGDVELGYFTSEGCDIKMPISELERAGDALSDENKDLSSKGKDKLFKVVYPKAESKLLQNDVLIMDSPGIGVANLSDGWIQKHCIDADLFVLVCDANSPFSEVEKNFIFAAKEKIGSPNVLVLCNKWDLTDSLENTRMQNLRQKYERDTSECFVELDLSPPCGAGNMPFFVSGEEMLNVRCNGFKNESDRSLVRQEEFSRFENSFKQCISASAISTKLASHVKRAIEINGEIKLIIDQLESENLDEQNRNVAEVERMNKQQDVLRNKFDSLKKFYELQLEDIRSMVRKEESERFQLIFDEIDSGLFFKGLYATYNNRDSDQVTKQKFISYVELKCKPCMESRYSVDLMTNILNFSNSVFEQAKLIYGGQHDAEFDKCCVDNKFSWASAKNTCCMSERLELQKPFDSERFKEALNFFNAWDIIFATHGRRMSDYLRNEYLPHLKSKLEQIRDAQAGKWEEQIIGELIKILNAVESVCDEIHRLNVASVSDKLDGQCKTKKDMEKICDAKRLSAEIGQDLNSFQMKHLHT